MKYSNPDVLGIIKSCSPEDPEKILSIWNEPLCRLVQVLSAFHIEHGCLIVGPVITVHGSMKKNKEKKERILIPKSSEQQLELWNGIYFKGRSYEISGETYTHIDKINTSDFSDGHSWDYIVQRKSDGLYFKFNVWDAGEYNGYLYEDEGLEQVFQVTKVTYE